MAGRFVGWKGDFRGFFFGLRANNNKAYFEAHRKQYEDEVKAPMLALLADLEAEFGPPQEGLRRGGAGAHARATALSAGSPARRSPPPQAPDLLEALARGTVDRDVTGEGPRRSGVARRRRPEHLDVQTPRQIGRQPI